MDLMRRFENWAAPVVIVLALGLVVWMISAAHGFGPLLDQPSKFKTFGDFFAVFIPSLTGMVGFWATLALNIPDFTRFGKRPEKADGGQAIGLPPTMLSSRPWASSLRRPPLLLYGKAMWDPVEVICHFSNTFVLLLGFFGIISRHPFGEYRRQCRLSGERFLQPHTEVLSASSWAGSSRASSASSSALEAPRRPERLHLRLARHLFRLSRAYCGRYHRRLLGRQEEERSTWQTSIRRRGFTHTPAGFNIKAIIALVSGRRRRPYRHARIPGLHILFDYAWFVGFAVAFIVYSLS